MTRRTPGESQFAHHPLIERFCLNPRCGLRFAATDPRQRYCTVACNHRAVQQRYRDRRKAKDEAARLERLRIAQAVSDRWERERLAGVV